MCKICDFIKTLVTVLLVVVGVLFVVYFWNLDMKLMGWAYKKMNIIFDRKETDIQF